MIIDSHQHYWQISRKNEWPRPELETLYRDFLPEVYEPLLQKIAARGSITVQTVPNLEETKFLLELANATPSILGVVGWIDFESENATKVLTELKRNPKFLGVRPMLQYLEDTQWILREAYFPIFRHLSSLQLTLDALICPQHLPHLIQFMEFHPDLFVVIDHGAKPSIGANKKEWLKNLAILSKHPHVFCKLSGLVTETSGDSFKWDDLKPYLENILDLFGPEKVMWGSDFPVLNLKSDFMSWFQFSWKFVEENYPKGLQDVFWKTAERFYLLARNGHPERPEPN